MKTHDKVREPLFHIAKRSGIVWWKAWLIRIVAIIAALLVCALVSILLTGENPTSSLPTTTAHLAILPARWKRSPSLRSVRSMSTMLPSSRSLAASWMLSSISFLLSGMMT